MKTRILTLSLLSSIALVSAVSQAAPPAAAGGSITFVDGLSIDAQDRVVLEKFVGHAVDYAEGLTAEKVLAKCKESPEMFAWVQFRYLNCLNVAFELTGDTRYLDLLADRLVLFRQIMTTGDDAFLGWYGKPIPPRRFKDKPDFQIDELQMNFRAMSVMARWVELARTRPEYAAANAKTIEAYLDLMVKHLYPKWDARGRFAEISGRGGVYHGLDYPSPVMTTLSHEKLSIMVDGLLLLHRVTGDDIYLKRALQVGAWFKSNLYVKDGHYEWMSWVPAGEWDVHPTKPDAWSVGWIAPDPNGPWYVTSASIAMSLYQHGLLFDDTDMARFVKTQKTMCWNGDLDKPTYRTVAGTTSKWVKGQFLSHQMAHYDTVLQKLAFEGTHKADAAKAAGSSWKGGANAQDYVREKFIMAPRVAKAPKPYAAVGKAFCADPANKAWYDELFFVVTATADATPQTPSAMPGLK